MSDRDQALGREQGACPDPPRLHDFHSGRLTEQAARLVAQHAESCETCLTELAELSLDDRYAGNLRAILPDGPGDLDRAPGSVGSGEPDPEHAALLSLLRESAEGERYEVLGELGHGGMGVVYEVRDRVLHRDLAMKVAGAGGRSASTADSPTGRRLARFLEEVRITGQLDHPSIIPVHELGVDAEGRAFFTMSKVHGRNLREVFEEFERGEGEWTLPGLVGLILRACDALAYAHSRHVVHRDLKPANIMVGRFGVVYVMDWGVAKVRPEDGPIDAGREGKADPTGLWSIREQSEDENESASALFTLDGEVLGTPAYMAPEQARGRRNQVDARADVYSMGAIFYRLLSGHRPYDDEAEPGKSTTTWCRLLEGPPAALAGIAPQAPPELADICERAMARDPAQRYPDMECLAADLRAWLEGRVVGAHASGPWAEAKKWVQRNKPLATALGAVVLALAAGLATSLVFKTKSDENAVLAADREKAARSSAALASRERDNVLRLSAFQELEDLRAEADALWPAVSDRIGEFRAWLVRAQDLIAGLEPNLEQEDPGHRAQLASLRKRALPLNAEERERERQSHPRFAELSNLERKLVATRIARDVRQGKRAPLAYELEPSQQQADAHTNRKAWMLVAPGANRIYGREAEGLALARLAYGAATTDRDSAFFGDTLAWALFANGLDDEALAASREALAHATATAELQADFQAATEQLEEAIRVAQGEAGAQAIADLETEIDALRDEVRERHSFTFADEEDRWWHAQLEKLVAEITTFADEEKGLVAGRSRLHGWGVAKRLASAEELERGFAPGGEYDARWERDLPAIRATYPGVVLPVQMGLVPIGVDPDSGLWEFWHLASGEEPLRGPNGQLELTEQSGLVLVLLPGGRFWMGAQASDPAGRNFDARARVDESPVHEVALSPFFLSKYELTQGQWRRMVSWNPSANRAGIPGITLRHPVEQVAYHECSTWLPRMDLALPSEAQWEYAARAGTDTPWWTGAEPLSLQELRAANLLDQSGVRGGIKRPGMDEFPELDDGAVGPAEVGTFAANAFGLHDVLGNVSELCLDAFNPYSPQLETDPVAVPPVKHLASFTSRGGSCAQPVSYARSATRERRSSTSSSHDVGVRPARAIER